MAKEILNIKGVFVPHTIIPIIGDATCLFRAISFHVFGTQCLGIEVREQVVEFVVSHWEEFSVMSHLHLNYCASLPYKEQMMRPDTYGSICELVAASRLFDFTFEVYRNCELYGSFGTNQMSLGRLRFTQDLSNGHFDCYIPVESEPEVCDQPSSTAVIENTQDSRISSKRRVRLSKTRRSSDQKRYKANTLKSKTTNLNKNDRADKDSQDLRPSVRSLWKCKALSGLNYNPDISYEQDNSIAIGAMIHKCSHCDALKWKDEPAGMCCCLGKVQLPSYEELPEPLHSLIYDLHPHHSHFMDRIRKYNSCFQMTSFGAQRIVEEGFMPTFKVQGQVYHMHGSLLPAGEETPKFLQIYFVGEDEKEVRLRVNNCPGVKSGLVHQLQTMLHNSNAYIRDLKTTIENIPNNCDNYQVVIHADRKPANMHAGRCNAPTTNEVALVLVGQQFDHRNIILQSRDNRLHRINEVHRSYDALQYPLLFCRGEDGYSIDIQQRDPITKQPLQKTVSAINFYSYQIMVRDQKRNHVLYCRSLFSQYIVDMYAKIETERLKFIKYNQSKLRAENYIHLRDAVGREDANIAQLGRMVVLPSTFTGSARYMHEKTQDAMTYVRHHGRPDLFITFTCNPKWDDIAKALFEGQKPHDRHDLIARVFRLKIRKLMNLLTKDKLFGSVLCFMYSVEWQKRGLPHIHILLWLEQRLLPNMIDSFISAELPDPVKDPHLYDIVKTNMTHGPCGALNPNSPCMKNGRCSKKYPRPFLKETQTGEDGYPLYRRRAPEDGGLSVKLRGYDIDNRWVVPYNPILLRSFNAHINVEYCNSVKSIKYICKYVNKGSDQATFALEGVKDEINAYESGRYISSSEAVWRIFAFPIHERDPTVMQLAVHLENGQRIYFNPDAPELLANQINNPRNTTLLSFFDLCKEDNFAKTLLYVEVPSYYVWKNNKFQRRKKGKNVPGWPGVKRDSALGRVYTIHPKNDDCFHLRLLLHTVRGPTSFENIRTVDGIVHATFRLACLALGLLENDNHWDKTLEEAALSTVPHKLRELFSIMLIFCQISNPQILWDKYKIYLSEDITRQALESIQVNVAQIMDKIFNRCLILIEDQVLYLGGQTLPHYGLPEVIRNQLLFQNRELLRETSYDVIHLAQEASENKKTLTDEQLYVHDRVLNSVQNQTGKLFFLDAPGGTGKTYLINLLLAQIRKNGEIALAVASSGIAATLLNGGKTAHSAFKLPLNQIGEETAICNISKQSNMAQVLKECKLIVWDESTMAHKGAFEALNRTLKDIKGNESIMGGTTVLLAGDFRQTLPICPRGTRADELKSCLKSSPLWLSAEKLSLTKNMRVHLTGYVSAGNFADLLLKIGNGDFPSNEGQIIIPLALGRVTDTLNDLIFSVYPDVSSIKQKPLDWLCERAILTTTNNKAAEINNILIQSFEEVQKEYISVDTVLSTDDAVHYPTEFLNSLDPPGLPPNRLSLKIGVPVMLLRNLNPPKLCNGTRFQIKGLHKNLIEATVLTGCARGETVFIPRIPLLTSDYPFEFKRLQFPLKVCFAITINKSQGQSLKVAGLDLRDDCFSHGQLYVACSRVSSANNLIILAPNGRTANVVYKEVLR